MEQTANTATKRIPVTEPTWKSLHQLRKPGQTYDELLAEMIELKQRQNLTDDLDACAKEKSKRWQVRKERGD